MILKDYAVNSPFDLGGIVVKREKWVEMETERTYPEGKKGSRVKRVTIGQVVPLFPGKMYPNENYFSLVVPNSVPEEIRDDFLRRCERKRELAELKKDPERMMRQVEAGIRFLKEEGRKIKMEQELQNCGQEGMDASETVQKEENGDGALYEFIHRKLGRCGLTVGEAAHVVILSGLCHEKKLAG